MRLLLSLSICLLITTSAFADPQQQQLKQLNDAAHQRLGEVTEQLLITMDQLNVAKEQIKDLTNRLPKTPPPGSPAAVPPS